MNVMQRNIAPEDEAQLLDAIDRWVETKVRPVVMEHDHGDIYPDAIVEQMKELGLFGATVSEEYGGLGLPATTYAKIVMRISSVWMAITGIFNSHLMMAAAIERFGTEEQKAEWLPKIASGEIRGGLALTEPDAGTDLQAIRTTARRDGDDYVINGTKTWITNGIQGSCFALLVKTDPAAQPRHKGMSLFIAPKGEGFRVGRKLEKLGYKSIDSGELVFEDYRVPASHLIGGEEGKGFVQVAGGLELGRINVAARGVGIAEGALRLAGEYAQVRKSFGKPICEHQAIQLKLGEMATRARAARLLTLDAAAHLRPRRALRHGGRHGEVLRLRGRRRERHGGHAHPRRLLLLQGVRHRALLSRRAADVHRRGHERDAAHHHLQAVDEAEQRRMRPLEGIRILTLEQFGAGPYGSMFLADLGAEVIKVENASTGGDASRHVGPHMLGENDSQYFQTFNLNKKSVALDLKTEAGRKAFRQLAKEADAVINNLRGDQPEKLGIDYASLREVNPAIVCLHISAYGRDNERRGWPGYDYLMQAEAGLMSVTGEPDGPPTRLGLSMIDFMSGITGSVGLLSALLSAQRTGTGCDVDVCLFDVALHQMSYPATWYLNAGDEPQRKPRSAHPSAVPVQTYPTSDGWLFIMCMTEKFWRELIAGMGRTELGEDPRFADMNARRANRDALTEILDEEFRKRPTEEWLSRLAGKLPVAPVNDVPKAFSNPFLETAGMLQTIAHPAMADLRVLSSPLKINGVRPTAHAARPLGADTEEVLSAAGCTDEDIAALDRHAAE